MGTEREKYLNLVGYLLIILLLLFLFLFFRFRPQEKLK